MVKFEVNEHGLIDHGASERGSHFYSSHLLCLRLGAWKAQNARSEENVKPEFKVGAAFHVAVAHALVNMDGQRALDWQEALDLYSRQHGIVLSTRMEVAGWVEAYLEEFARRFGDSVEVLDVEIERRFRIKSSLGDRLFTQRVDATLRWKKSRAVFFLDHKTTWRISKRVLEEYELDLQFVSYRAIGDLLYGEDFDGVFVGFALKNIPSKAKFERLSIAPRAVDDFISAIEHVDEMLERYKGRDWREYPPAFTAHTCRTRYRACDLAPYCRYGMEVKR